MIDANCSIYQDGSGFCWCPSAAWNLTDADVCHLCKLYSSKGLYPRWTSPLRSPVPARNTHGSSAVREDGLTVAVL